MKIRFTRTGGVAGARLNVEVDTDTLPPEDAKPLRDLIAAASPALRRSRSGGAESGADRFVYRIALDDGGRKTEIDLDDSSIAPELQPLLDHLLERARRARAKTS